MLKQFYIFIEKKNEKVKVKMSYSKNIVKSLNYFNAPVSYFCSDGYMSLHLGQWCKFKIQINSICLIQTASKMNG